MKIISKLTNVQAIAGISIRPGLNTLGVKKLEAIKKHPRMKKYFAEGKLAEVKDEPKGKKKPTPPVTPPPDPKPEDNK